MRRLVSVTMIITSIIIFTGCGNSDIIPEQSQESTSEQTSTTATSTATTATTITSDSAANKSNNDSIKNPDNNQTPNVLYNEYSNARYGFSIEYPSTFKVKVSPDNGDGMIFSSSDGAAELIVSGINNTSNQTVTSSLANELKSHSNASYKKQQDNWYAVSWIDGDNIVYEKRIVGNGSINTLLIKYPISQKESYDLIVNHLVSTFNAGGINESH